jgi:hypothetical protein
MIAERSWKPVTRRDALEGWWADERHLSSSWQDFVGRRRPIINALPLDTTWWRVSSLGWYDLRELHAITSFHHSGLSSLFELAAAAPAPLPPLQTEPSTWRGLLLYAHARLGPFTVLEGNHRLLSCAYAGPRERPLALSVFVALSEQDCQWHCPVGP